MIYFIIIAILVAISLYALFKTKKSKSSSTWKTVGLLAAGAVFSSVISMFLEAIIGKVSVAIGGPRYIDASPPPNQTPITYQTGGPILLQGRNGAVMTLQPR